MARYIIRRVIFSIPVLLISSVLVFVVVRATADPTAALHANPRVRAEDVAKVRHSLGLDQSGFHQYTAWLTHFVRGDWGSSLIAQRSVAKDIREALVNSAVLGLTGIGISLFIGVGIGVL